jgi:hypothetical protein
MAEDLEEKVRRLEGKFESLSRRLDGVDHKAGAFQEHQKGELRKAIVGLMMSLVLLGIVGIFVWGVFSGMSQ